MKTMTEAHLKDIFTSLDSSQIVWSIKFLTDILANKNSEPQEVVKAEESVESKEDIPDPKPIWWDYPISPTVMAMTFEKRCEVSSDNYKEELTKILEEKYK